MAELTNDGVILIAKNGNIAVVCCQGTYYRIETIDDGRSIVTILNSDAAGTEIDFIKLTTTKKNMGQE